MSTIIGKKSSDTVLALDNPPAKAARILDCTTGGYSVWNCLPESKAQVSATGQKRLVSLD